MKKIEKNTIRRLRNLSAMYLSQLNNILLECNDLDIEHHLGIAAHQNAKQIVFHIGTTEELQLKLERVTGNLPNLIEKLNQLADESELKALAL